MKPNHPKKNMMCLGSNSPRKELVDLSHKDFVAELVKDFLLLKSLNTMGGVDFSKNKSLGQF
eukprot:snap_masked-scaffold_27-processed-gene-3.15-mRNA-1 protein AED:1.00 eAED:1.00 QI:0/0/0/0/1/1/2/0/61